jgi:hypothetical protein
MVPGLEGLQQPAPDLTAPNSWRMSRPLQIFGGVLAGEGDKAARAAAASSVGVGLSSRRIAAVSSGRYRWTLARRKLFWASARPVAVHRRRMSPSRRRATFVNGPVSPGGALIPSLIVQAGGAAR